MELLIARQARLLEKTLNDKLVELERNIGRMERERNAIREKLLHIAITKEHGPKTFQPLVSCPKCGRDQDFLTDNGGYLAHVLEDPNDTDALEPGKPLFCPSCGDVFLFEKFEMPKAKVAARKSKK